MELRYRGNVYQAQNTQVETLDLGEKAQFLGQTYVRRRPKPQYTSQLGIRKYRGIIYGG